MSERDIGRHAEAIDTLKAQVAAMQSDVTDIKAMLAQARGGYRTLIAVGSIGGAVGAALLKGLSMMKAGQ
jgi:hypothetical protein